MALSKKAIQRKREKRNKKRKANVSKFISSEAVNYGNWPIYECWVPIYLWERGLSQVIISRKRNENDIAIGIFLVDIFCLGVKDCLVRKANMEDYEDMLADIEETDGELKRVEPVYANTLIRKAVAYAKQFSFNPHPDFAKYKKILKDIEIDESLEFRFGIDGKPKYIPGPYDTHENINRITRVLVSHYVSNK